MSVVKGYHKHLEKAEEALKKDKDDKTVIDDDHDIYHSSTVFKCWKCCLYEEKLQKQRTRVEVDPMQAWKEAEKKRRSSIKGHAAEAEQKKLMNRALDAERKYQRLLLQQALREEQNKRQRNNAEWSGTQPSVQPMPWPPPPPGWRGTNPNVRPGPPPGWPPGWTFPPPYPNRRPQGQQPPAQPPKRPIQPPGPPQPPASPAQPQPKPLLPQDGKKRPTEQNVKPSKGQGQGQRLSPIPSKTGKLTESNLPTQDQKTKKSTKSKPSTATTTGSNATYILEPTDELDWQSLSEEPPRQSGIKRLSEPTKKPQNPSRRRRYSK